MIRSTLAFALLLLTGCVVAMPQPVTPPASPPPPAAFHTLPNPVWPDECVANWYAKAQLPPCVESWITDITKQQKAITKQRKSLGRRTAKKHPAKPARIPDLSAHGIKPPTVFPAQ